MKLEDALKAAALTGNGCAESTHRFWYWAITEKVPRIRGAVVEVGCRRGGGSTTLAAACEEQGFELHCVDTWCTDAVDYQRTEKDFANQSRGYPLFIQHVDQLRAAGLNHLVFRHVGDSKRIGPTLNVSCVFLWVDAWHEWPAPYLDFLAFKRLVVPGGIVGFHDVDGKGVLESLRQLEEEGHFKGWKELEDIPRLEWVLPEEKRTIKEELLQRQHGFWTRAWERKE